MSNKKIVSIIYGTSVSIFLGLCWYIYLAPKGVTDQLWIKKLPLLNCIMNSFSASCLVLGIIKIKNKNERAHKRYMLSALLFSALFLLSYLYYHHFHGDTLFMGTGWTRPIYFFTLISHILLTLIGLPFILITFFYGLTNQLTLHKKFGKLTFPIWLYISITGVLIYVFQKILQ